MKEAIVAAGPKVEIKDSPIPEPGSSDVVIKVVVSGSNPKDWKRPEMGSPHNSGDDIAGTVHAVGDDVVGFHPGDRVAAFHQMMSPHGSFAEYALAKDYTTFHLPKNISFEEGAAIPLACMTAAVGLFIHLRLPEPWQKGAADGEMKEPDSTRGPLLVYGAASAVGAYAIQLAKRAGIGPIIGVAGKGIPFVESFLDKSAGDAVVDYRNGDEKLVEDIKKALNGKKLKHAYDAVSEKGSYQNIAKVLDTTGQGEEASRLTHVLPKPKDFDLPQGITLGWTMVGCVHGTPVLQSDFGQAWFTLFGKGLKEGWLKPHPQEVVPGGLGGVETGLKNLKDGKASAVKYVFRIADTK